MKKGSEKGSTSGASLSNMKRFAKLFLINNHSDQLEDFDERLARIVESGECKKIIAVRVKQSFDDPRLVHQIIEGMEKARKQIEGGWKSLKGDLETDIWTQWAQSIEESTAKYDKRESREHETSTKKEHPTTSRGSKGFTKEHAKNKRAAAANAESGLYEKEEDKEEEVHHPSLIPRLIPSADMKVLFDELRSRDLLMADYYILILCRTPAALIKDLLHHGVAIAAVIHFIPCPVSALEAQLPDVHEDIRSLKKSLETKHIGIFTSTLPIESLAKAAPSDIYEQLKSYLFDIEMLSQHFPIYQSEFLEINDALTSKENLIRSFQVHSSKQSSDITAVCVYFDNLCRMVETHTANERRYSSFHPRPFLDNDYNKVIIEDANDLLKSAIATQMNLVCYWKAVDIVINAIRQTETDSHCSVDHIKLPLFKELLSWESFAQRLEMVKGEYDHCCRKDLSDRFKLFVFRRTFHKILETTKKFHLPTRLCFRDFCSYIAPRYVAVLRRRSESFSLLSQESADQEDDDSTQDTQSVLSQITADGRGGVAYFSGLTFDDTFQELAVVEKAYRFHRSGCIRVRLENWLHKERKLTVEISLFQCVIFAHRWDEYLATLFPRVRLISKNGITCNVEMSENPAQPYISIQWPNDCQIRYICENGVGAVEQRYYWATSGEYKRVYTNRGCVLVYLRSGHINVLTPNGIFYQLYPESPDKLDDCKPLASTDISTELAFVSRLTSYGIDCKCFDVTRNDGRQIRVLNGVAIEERARYLVYEWMDLGFGEMFAERDDGVKLISSYYGLKTYYPCGTMIHTVTEEEYIELDMDCRSPSTENILRKINPDIIRRLEEKRIQRELWLSFNLTYHVRHERYASITCYEETKMIIQSPDHVKVTVTGDAVVIDVGVNVSLRFTPDLCTITSSYDNDMSIKLNLIPNDDEILCYQSANAKVTLKENGQLISDEDFIPIEPYDEELYFLTKQYKFGIAFIPEYEFNEILQKNKKSPFFHESTTKVVILKNVLPLNDRFSMPIPDMDSNLDKLFITKCRRKHREHYQTENVFSVRTIIKLDSIPKDLCDFLRCYSYIEMTLSENIQDALECWFAVKHVKQKHSPAWKEKIKDTRVAIRRNKKRAPIYHAMMQYKVFPKYHEFVDAGRDVDNVNVEKLIPILAGKGFKGFHNPK